MSTSFGSLDEPLGEGTLRFRQGGFVDQGIQLSQLNGGNGIQRGEIRMTDRSGNSAVIDLRFAHTVDDVLEAINSNFNVNVTAVTDGDALKLIDNTGQTASNLIVQELTGTTAADLGIDGINVAATAATGQDVLSLYENLHLARLNDGNGVALRSQLPDLEVPLADGSTPLSIDLGDVSTLGELLQAINEADPARLSAAISSDGDHIELTDLTSGPGMFSVSSPVGGTAAEDLGLTGSASGGVITSDRLQAGLKTSLLTSLAGGGGLGLLGNIQLTDRTGTNVSLNLSSAETLQSLSTPSIRRHRQPGSGLRPA